MKKTATTPQKPKKEKWLKINVEASVNTDIAPKWFKAKIKEVQKDGNLTEEQATQFLIKNMDNFLSKKIKNLNPTKEMFLTNKPAKTKV